MAKKLLAVVPDCVDENLEIEDTAKYELSMTIEDC